MAEDAGRVKRVDELGATGDADEDRYYLNKIKKLVEEKMKLLLPQPQPQEQEHVLPKKVMKAETILESKPPMHKKRKVQARTPLVSNQVTQLLKRFITNEMNGEEVKVVIQKRLYESDLKENQNRLNIPINQLETHDFLTEQEKRDLKDGKGLEVGLLGPRLLMHEKPMVLRMWNLNSSSNYVLRTNWNGFVKANEEDLKENTMIQVWSFRKHNQLCFAIICLEGDVEDHQNDAVAAAPVILVRS